MVALKMTLLSVVVAKEEAVVEDDSVDWIAVVVVAVIWVVIAVDFELLVKMAMVVSSVSFCVVVVAVAVVDD